MSTRAAILGVMLALALLVGAQLVRFAAVEQRKAWPAVVDQPYAPSPGAAPYVSLGYRELGADVFWARMRAYFGGDEDNAVGLRGLVDALIALDPTFHPVYQFAARAIGWVDGGTSQDDLHWAVRVLERGLEQYPDDWKLLKLLGETYLLDLETDDPTQRSAWDELGARLLERAIRSPGAPRNLGTLIANVRSGLGQHERAVEGLLELIRTTDDRTTREKLIAKLADLTDANADQLVAEETLMLERFKEDWKRVLPEGPATLYLLVGEPPPPYIDLDDLAADQALFLDEDVLAPITD